jgi:hypothetical protein
VRREKSILQRLNRCEIELGWNQAKIEEELSTKLGLEFILFFSSCFSFGKGKERIKFCVKTNFEQRIWVCNRTFFNENFLLRCCKTFQSLEAFNP